MNKNGYKLNNINKIPSSHKYKHFYCNVSFIQKSAIWLFGQVGGFPLWQRFCKFQSEFKWKLKAISVSSGLNIWDRLWRWSTYFDWNILTEILCSWFLTNQFFALKIREFGKGITNGNYLKSLFYWLGWFNWVKCHSIFLGYWSPDLWPVSLTLWKAPVDSPSGQATIHSHLLDEQGIGQVICRLK